MAQFHPVSRFLLLVNSKIPNTSPSYDSKRETRYAGLKNLGATGYMNTVLQSLFYIHCFRKVLSCPPPGPIRSEPLPRPFTASQPKINVQQRVSRWRSNAYSTSCKPPIAPLVSTIFRLNESDHEPSVRHSTRHNRTDKVSRLGVR